jgi:hypothetical protein
MSAVNQFNFSCSYYYNSNSPASRYERPRQRFHKEYQCQFVDPKWLKAIATELWDEEKKAFVSFWSDEEAETCAKMVSAICKMRYKNSQDPIYDFNDFVLLACYGILMAKNACKEKGVRLTPFFCNGYVQKYTSEECNMQKRLRALRTSFVEDVPDLVIYHKQNGLDAETRSDYIPKKEEILEYVLKYLPGLHRFAVDYFNCYEEYKRKELRELKEKYGKAFVANKKELKEKYGKTFGANEKTLFALIRELAPSYEWSK